jgi:hypothetical protein
MWVHSDDNKGPYDTKLIIYDFYNKKQVYEDNIKYTPLTMCVVGSTIVLKWRNDKLLAYNIKYLI